MALQGVGAYLTSTSACHGDCNIMSCIFKPNGHLMPNGNVNGYGNEVKVEVEDALAQSMPMKVKAVLDHSIPSSLSSLWVASQI